MRIFHLYKILCRSFFRFFCTRETESVRLIEANGSRVFFDYPQKRNRKLRLGIFNQCRSNALILEKAIDIQLDNFVFLNVNKSFYNPIIIHEHIFNNTGFNVFLCDRKHLQLHECIGIILKYRTVVHSLHEYEYFRNS